MRLQDIKQYFIFRSVIKYLVYFTTQVSDTSNTSVTRGAHVQQEQDMTDTSATLMTRV